MLLGGPSCAGLDSRLRCRHAPKLSAVGADAVEEDLPVVPAPLVPNLSKFVSLRDRDSACCELPELAAPRPPHFRARQSSRPFPPLRSDTADGQGGEMQHGLPLHFNSLTFIFQTKRRQRAGGGAKVRSPAESPTRVPTCRDQRRS